MKTFDPVISMILAVALFMGAQFANATTSTFKVENDGQVDAYFAGGSASYLNIVGAYFSDTKNYGGSTINGQTSIFGQHFDLGNHASGSDVSFYDFVFGVDSPLGIDVWRTNAADNVDGQNHIFHSSFTLPDGTPALFVSFEDIRGLGDRDFNDIQVVFTNISPVPEPETYLMMLIGLGLVGFAVKRK